MKHLTTSFELFTKFLDSTPREEIAALVSKIDSMGFGGPTLGNYLLQVDHDLQVRSWLTTWPAAAPISDGNWEFGTPSHVTFEKASVVTQQPSVLKHDAGFTDQDFSSAA